MEGPEQEGLFLRRERRQPRAVLDGPRSSSQPGAGRRAAQLLCLPLRGGGWEEMGECSEPVLVRRRRHEQYCGNR